MSKLTKRIVDGAELKDRSYFIWCSELRGFGVRVFPTGKRTYVVDYRTAGGSRRRMSLGPHGVLTTEEARKLAIATLGEVVRGDDPQLERTTRRKSLTVAELCEHYLAAADKGLILGKRGTGKKASTIATDRGRVAQHIVPLLGTKLVIELTRSDVSRFIRDVQAGKTAKREASGKVRGVTLVTGGAGTAARTAGLLGSILTFAVNEGIIEANPATGVRKPAYNKRERRLTAEEYGRLGKALAEAEEEGERQQAIDAARLLILTGCRLGEILKLRWGEVDFAGQCIRLADSKEGRSVRPIGRKVVELLEEIRAREDEGAFVLPGVRGEGHYAGFPVAWRRLMKRAELDGVTAHTLRHSFASVAGDLGMAESTIAALLGHSAGSVTSRYVHHLDTVLIAAADKVARTIHGMTGAECKVVQLPSHTRQA